MQALKAVSLIELDVNKDLISWAFPKVEPECDAALKARSGLTGDLDECPFRFSRFGDTWQYMATVRVEQSEDDKKKASVTAVAVCVLADEFNPAKFQDILNIFTALYTEEQSPIPLMKAYLTIFTRGKLKTAHGIFNNADYDNRKALVSPVKDLFALFGVETIVIWTAMLLRKRVFVYADKPSVLMQLVRSFPLLGAWHRQNWSLLRPIMTQAEGEMEDLKSLGYYVAGFTDASCQQRTRDYDLYVDLSARSFTIAEHAQAEFSMGKYHKATSQAFVQACEEGNDQAVIQTVALKTKELIDNLRSLAVEYEDGTYITKEELAASKQTRNMAGFLYHVALAEGLTKQHEAS
jgi:hypothetical protein